MSDPVSSTLTALAHADASALPLAFAAGTVTSIGPCVAPRYVAIAALIGRAHNRGIAVAAFVAGLLAGYVALGFGVGLVAALVAHASTVYLVLAVGLAAGGILQLVHCTHPATERCTLRASGIFSLGAGSALILSPCCTPIVAAVAAGGAVDGRPGASALVLLAFALGHSVPLLGLGAGGTLFAPRFASAAGGSISATISGALMLGLGGYYGLLA